MATKAELAAELANLKAEMERRDAIPDTIPDEDTRPSQSDPQPDPDQERQTGAWNRMLASHGLDPDDTRALLGQLSEELGDLPANKPLITAIAAFGLGFVLGRMSK